MSRRTRRILRRPAPTQKKNNYCSEAHRRDGIILAEIEEPSAITKVAAGVGEVRLPRVGKATAIYVAADSASSVAACAHYKGPSWLRRHFFW
jgi:hypothetical protein